MSKSQHDMMVRFAANLAKNKNDCSDLNHMITAAICYLVSDGRIVLTK